jgi:hypothetical protein
MWFAEAGNPFRQDVSSPLYFFKSLKNCQFFGVIMKYYVFIVFFLIISAIQTIVPSYATRGTLTEIDMPRLVINEVEFGPPSDPGWWVELYNAGDAEVDLAGWTISSSLVGFLTFPENAKVPAKGFYVFQGCPLFKMFQPEGDYLVLRSPEGVEVDRTTVLVDPYLDERTWQRIIDGADTDTQAEWVFKSATKGTPNGNPEDMITIISCRAEPEIAIMGEEIVLSGMIIPSRPSEYVKITAFLIKAENSIMSAVLQTEVQYDGRWEATWVPNSPGVYKIEASIPETESFPAISSPPCHVQVLEKPPNLLSTIALVLPSEAYVASSIRVTGMISPPHSDAQITLIYKLIGTDKQVIRETKSFPDGKFVDIFKPDKAGIWIIVASWLGDADHQPASSEPVILTVYQPTITVTVEPEELEVTEVEPKEKGVSLRRVITWDARTDSFMPENSVDVVERSVRLETIRRLTGWSRLELAEELNLRANYLLKTMEEGKLTYQEFSDAIQRFYTGRRKISLET